MGGFNIRFPGKYELIWRYITMENVMTNGFTEITENELMNVDGGVAWVPIIIVALAVMVITKGCSDAESEAA